MGRNQRRETTTRPAALSQRKSRRSRSLYDKNVQAKPSDTGHTLKHNMKDQKSKDHQPLRVDALSSNSKWELYC